jgi:hypothetical protein
MVEVMFVYPYVLSTQLILITYLISVISTNRYRVNLILVLRYT